MYFTKGTECADSHDSKNRDNQRGGSQYPEVRRKGQLRIAIYARYSTDGQKETSIDDQVRTCKDVATQSGFVDADFSVFADDAVSGSRKGTHKRMQYHALRKAIQQGDVDIIMCDQQCRLARHAREALSFFEDLKSYNVRLMTADGFDSTHGTAQLMFGLKSVFAEFFLEETQHRVRRGMKGEFARGAMVTGIPFGYELDAETSSRSGRCTWRIVPKEVEVVLEIFRLRKNGRSFNQIAADLNRRGVPTPRLDVSANASSWTYWRAAGIWRILRNPIYKGVYTVNFRSSNTADAASATRYMPELALLRTQDWDACQVPQTRVKSSGDQKFVTGRSSVRRATYGGGRHALSGVIRCGTCGVPLSCHHAREDSGSLYCVQCEHAMAAGVPGRKAHYVSIKGVKEMLHSLLRQIVAGEALADFREKLKLRLMGGRDAEIAAVREELRKAKEVRRRIANAFQRLGEDDEELGAQFLLAREKVLALACKVQEIELSQAQANSETIQKQLEVDLEVVLDAFLTDLNTPEKTRVILMRIFPTIKLVAKPNRFAAIFEVHIKPGAILAEASGTSEVADDQLVKYIRLNTSGAKYPVWTIDELSAWEPDSEHS